MKIPIKILFFLVFGYVVSTAQPPTSGLVVYYNFNRDVQKDSARIYDQSSNRNHGTVLGTVLYTPDRFGVPCSALWFDGYSYVTVPSSFSLKKPQKELTIAVWFKIAHGSDFFKQWITICCKGDQSYETDDCPQYRMQATAQTVSINTAFTEEIIPQLKYETWYFYAYTFDGNKVSAYLDGRKFFELDYSGKLEPNDMPLEIGRDLPGALEYYYGAMDDLRIYDQALSDYELDQLYNDRSEANAPDRCALPKPDPNSATPSSPKPDPTPQKPDPVSRDSFAGLPRTLENDSIKYQKVVFVSSREVSFYPYDNEKQDGDIVSININGVWVRENYELKNKKPSPTRGDIIKCSLNPGDSNYFITKAWNLGTIPPNTLTVEINDGTSTQKVTINSNVGLSGGIRIVVGK
ncbi:MAG: LamG domain-containing protein [Saprospiraceae bacterium]|jgi:hypothetical protein